MSSKMLMYFFLQSKINEGYWWRKNQMDMLYACSDARSWRHVIRNYAEKSNAFYKKMRVTTQRVYGKTTMSGRFWTLRRRWDEAYVNRDLFSVITWITRITEQASICVFIKHIHLY